MDRKDVLEQALKAVEDRNDSYGDIVTNFQRIADFWNIWLYHRGIIAELDIEPRDVAKMMRFVKDARLLTTSDHEDSIVDGAGYDACYAECATPQPKEATDD